MTKILHELPFSRTDLEPTISRETIDYHYGKHHKGYIDKLNSLIIGTKFEDMTITEIVLKSDGLIFNNAAQAWNHEFYWQSLAPKRQQPTRDLLHAIEKKFTTLQKFNEEFCNAAEGVFGSGWTWLVTDDNGNISIKNTSDADTPIREGKTPLLVVDVWEHAYYLDFRNERAKYLKAVTKILNWEFAERNFNATLLSATG